MKRGLVILLFPLTAGSALAAGRASLNVYFQSNLKNTGYQNRTFEKVVRTWRAPEASQVPEVGRKTVVQAVFAKDGKLVSATVSMSSGKKGWDAAALAAVKSAAPFEPLPEGFTAPTVEVHFHVSVVP
ncbi:MAG TPA: TonB family protein [Thermoanaerobaculia bacterium]|nr:TonB family protein [Thermoanaerobaculia bacterium]